jgi:hypothetical protein
VTTLEFMREFGTTLQVVRDMPFARQYKLTVFKEPLSSSGQGKGLQTMKVAAEKLPPEEQRRYIHYPQPPPPFFFSFLPAESIWAQRVFSHNDGRDWARAVSNDVMMTSQGASSRACGFKRA